MGKENRLTSLTDLPVDMLEKIKENSGKRVVENKVFVPYAGDGSTFAVTSASDITDCIRGTGTYRIHHYELGLH